MEALERAGEEKLALRYLCRLGLQRAAPAELRERLVAALQARRARWLVRSRNWDLLDQFFAQAMQSCVWRSA